MQEEVLQQVDRNRIVELACNLANTVSITGEEEEVAKYIGSELEQLGMTPPKIISPQASILAKGKPKVLNIEKVEQM